MTTDVSSTSNMFLSRALKKILSEKETKRSQHAALRAACEKALGEIDSEIAAEKTENEGVGPNSPMPPPPPGDSIVNADKYFTPFRLACESKSPRIIRTALDCLQKLMAYGHLTGNMLAEVEGFPDAMRLVDLIVDTVCRCFVGDSTDEGVQLQIIKALLTAVTSTTCEVHEGTLLKAVRTCYNIYLASKSSVNQTTAKATLTQMLSVIFQRMESLADHPDYQPTDVKIPVAAQDVEESAQQQQPKEEAKFEDSETEETAEDQPALEASIDDASAPASVSGEQSVEGFVRSIVDQAVEKVFTPNAGKYGVCIACGKPADKWCKDTQSPVCSVECKEANLRNNPPAHNDIAVSTFKDEKYGHVYRKDAFLVFRSMCKLSMKELPDKDTIDSKSHELRSKVLSLQLQLSILQNAGPAFQADDLFIDAIKQYLCPALSRNGVSHVPNVFELSLNIFLTLLLKFKSNLKMEIEIFFKEILLSMLEISTSSFQHKWLVMVCLRKVCNDAQTVIDLYLNYDCDEYLTNVFERLLNDLSKVAQGRASSELGSAPTPQQEQNMKTKGLECLVSIMRCLDAWSKPLTDDLDPSDDTSSQTPLPSEVDDEINETVQAESRKQKKEIREQGLQLFIRRPKKGLKFLQQNGFVGESVDEVAHFLLEDDRLDRTAIGEILGDPDEHFVAIMHRYTDIIDFSQTPEFLASLRLFLSNFRLPGEAQKIDRLMEKFAATYITVHRDQGIFASADAAYVLAYSVMILTTDLHSAKVKKKITKEEFVRMTRGINDNRDLPREFVEQIYDEIEKNEIRMRGQEIAAPETPNSQNAKQRMAKQRSEMKNLAANAERELDRSKDRGEVDTTFILATHVEHVRPMFKLVWRPLLAAFTVTLNATTEPQVIELCLEGLQISIHIACIFGMELERHSFVQSLAKFTNLGSNLTEIKTKHIGAIKCMLNSALNEGNYLGPSWKDVLTCVSQLELAQLIGSGAAGTSQKARRVESLSETASQNIVVAVDKLFTRTKSLNGDAIVDFVTGLCSVSMDELLQTTPPRMYSLSRLVEIAYYNMERVRIEWSHIWQVMGDHFNKVGCMANDEVAFFAVDSLRQLSMKFLEKGELANYSFQKDFLRPFEYIMSHNKAASIRDMVVRCVAQMVQSKANNIRSGWKNIFFVFSLAASDNDQNIVELAFSTTTHIFDNYFSKQHDHRASLIAGSFMDAVNCLAEFASNSYFMDVSMEAIRQLSICATHVNDSPELFVVATDCENEDEPMIWVRGWFPILFGLSRIISRCKLDIRTRALQVMFDIMKNYGHNFLAQWWKDLFRVVFRIFDDKNLQSMGSEQEKMEWMNTTCNHALRSIVDVVSQFFDILQSTLFQDMVGLLSWCIHRDNEQLARAGTECLHILVLTNGSKFTDESWEHTCGLIKDLFNSTAPQELMDFSPTDPGILTTDDEPTKKEKVDHVKQKEQTMFNSIIIKCIVQLELIQTVEWILLSSTRPERHSVNENGEEKVEETARSKMEKAKRAVLSKQVDTAGDMFACLTTPRLLTLLDCLLNSYNFAKKFNANSELRTALCQAGFMKNRSKPNLLKQETTSLSCGLRVMFRIYADEQRNETWESIEKRVLELCHSTIKHYLAINGNETRLIWAPLVVLIIREVMALEDDRFQVHASAYYGSICDILSISYDAPLGDVAFSVGSFFQRARKCVM